MSDTFDDLKGLKAMLDAGEVTPEEYEVVKAELVGDLKPEETSVSTQPAPGWYEDPDDVIRQRYWDGNAWTESRQLDTETSLAVEAHKEPVLFYKTPGFIAVAVLFVLSLFSLISSIASGDTSGVGTLLAFLGVLALIGYQISRSSGKDQEVTTIHGLPPSVQMAASQMSPPNQSAFFLEYNQKRRKNSVGYTALILIGWHYLYVGKVGVQFAFWLTFGGFFIWWFVDLFRMPSIIAEANDAIARRSLQTLAVGQQFLGGNLGGATPPPPPT